MKAKYGQLVLLLSRLVTCMAHSST